MDVPGIGVIVVAAGSGVRLGAAEPKAFVDLGGITILERALGGVFGSLLPAHVVIVAPATHLGEAQRIGERAAGVASVSVTVVVGSDHRQRSVAAGLAALPPTVHTVLVHDAARALTSAAQFDRVSAAVLETGHGVVPALAVTDTIKRTRDGVVVETVARSELAAVQTPQGFPRAELEAAYAAATVEHTDDAALFAAAGHPVDVVDGEGGAFKITTAWDLQRASHLVDELEGGLSRARTGVGIDVHAYDPAEPLWLGGLLWPGEVGLAGHSDGDALSHAVCDALLSAAGLGDIGAQFGTDDPRFAGAHAEVFITETVSLLGAAGFTAGNVAVQLVGVSPRLGPRRSEVERHLTALVGAPVSVSATTSDGLGFTGRSEGITVVATALVIRGR